MASTVTVSVAGDDAPEATIAYSAVHTAAAPLAGRKNNCGGAFVFEWDGYLTLKKMHTAPVIIDTQFGTKMHRSMSIKPQKNQSTALASPATTTGPGMESLLFVRITVGKVTRAEKLVAIEQQEAIAPDSDKAC